MIVYLYGADTFRSRQYLAQSIAKFRRERDPDGYNVIRLDALTKAEAGRLLDELNASPFLAERRLVVIENLLSLSDRYLLNAFLEICQQNKLPKTTAVIVWQGEAPSKLKEAAALAKRLAGEQYAQEFTPLTGAKLRAWVERAAAARGATLTPEALNWLQAQGGGDLWQLNSVLNQVTAWSAGRAVTLSDLALFGEAKLDDNLFNLVAAVVEGNRATALKLLQYQRRQGEDEAKIFGLLVWQYRTLLMIGDAVERERDTTSTALAKTLKLHPYVVKKNLGLVRRLPLSRLRAHYRRLLTIDRQTKTGAAPQSLLLDLFIASPAAGQ